MNFMESGVWSTSMGIKRAKKVFEDGVGMKRGWG